MTLETIKNYLRIDSDLTEDDMLIKSLMEASINYIESYTGKRYNDNEEIFATLSLLLISNWYSNRNIANKSASIDEYPHTISAMMNSIKFNPKYSEVF